jgi:hypothetical protein
LSVSVLIRLLYDAAIPPTMVAHAAVGAPQQLSTRGQTVAVGCQLRRAPTDEVTTPQSSEPILIPKVRIYFADFPCPPFATKSETTYLGLLLRIWVQPRAMIIRSANFSRANKQTPDSSNGDELLTIDHHASRLNGLQRATDPKRARMPSPSL